jgi:hypothetical protein
MPYEPKIVSRDGWGAREPKRALVRMSNSIYVVGHHTVSNVDQALDDPAQAVRDIQAMHLADRANDYSDIGYNWLVAPDGTIFEGRGWNRNGANGSGSKDPDITNANSTSIALIGRGDDPRCLTVAAKQAFSWLVAAHVYLWKDARLRGHRDKEHTACPGDAFYEWIRGGAVIPINDKGDPLPDPDPEVQPMFQPPISVQVVAACAGPNGKGALILGLDGGVFITPDAEVKAAAPNQHISPVGQSYWSGRHPALIEVNDDGTWTVVATSGERYTYPTDNA